MIQDIYSRFSAKMNQLIIPKEHNHIALAISGGSDSVALLELMGKWASSHSVDLIILHVNHHLRSNSGDDARFVESICNKMGYQFHHLEWQHNGQIQTAIQQQAREARYALMHKKCQELGVKILLTAHHQDDLIETYLMRKKRGSGPFGLSHSDSFFFHDLQVFRPLLPFSKQDLLHYLQENSASWVEDPSNISDNYERNRVRKSIEKYSTQEKENILLEMRDAQQQAFELNEKLIAFLAEYVAINRLGYAIVDLKHFDQQVYDLQLQITSHILTIISGQTTPPRHRNIEPLILRITQESNFKVSLHGCLLVKKNNKLLICREPQQYANQPLTAGNVIWDDRFEIKANLSEDYSVDFLRPSDFNKIRGELTRQQFHLIDDFDNKLILFSLPAIKKLEKLVAIPHISYYDIDEREDINIEIIFKPNFISRFTHFL